MKYNKGFAPLAIIAIIVGVLVIGVGAYYLGTKNNSIPKNTEENNIPKENQNSITNTPEQNNQANNTVLPTNITTSNIKGYSTYTSASYLYKFDHDSTRFISDPNPQGKEVSINDGDCVSSECATLYRVIFRNNINKLADLKSVILNDLGANISGCKSSNPIWNSNPLKIDNKETIQLNYSPCAGPHEGILKTVLGTIYNGNGYVISFVGQYGGEYKGQMKTEFDNLVSSFKFLEGTVTACDLKVALSAQNPSTQVVASGTNNFKFMMIDLTAIGCDMNINNIDIIIGQFLPSIPVANLISNLVIKDESNLKLNSLATPSYGSNNMIISDLTVKKGETKQISIFADIESGASGKKEAFGINVIATGSDGLKLNTGQLDGNHMTIQ